MTDRIVSILKEAGVHAFEVTENEISGWEFYFIRHALDQNRAKKVRHTYIKVFETTDGGKTLGSASAEAPEGSTDEELEKLVSDLKYRASLVKNEYYTLNPPVSAPASPETHIDVSAIAADFIRTMKSLPETENEDVNSYEIFVRDVRRRLVTSTGIDVTERYPSSMIEAVLNARRDGHEIELYRSYDSGTCDAEGLRRDLIKTMEQGRDRLASVPTPALGKTAVIFSTDDAREIYNYFLDRLDPALIYRHFSDWEIGKPVSDGITGDRMTVKTARFLPNSSRNFTYDSEGAPIRDMILMEDSVPVAFTGGRMFSSFMGLENTFSPTNAVFSGGTKTEEEIRTGAYLEAVAFSDFQVDSITGDIFGELRLGYLHDGNGNVTPVSGGSISGSMSDFIKNMSMSEESVRYNDMEIPRLTRFEDVTFAG